MSTVSLTGASAYAGNDRLLAGIVMSVLTFWLFAQSVINVVPAMQNSLDIALETLTLAVSLSALFSGCFVVACGGFADKFGRMRLTMIGLILSMIGSGLLFISWEPVLFLLGRAIQGLSAACIMPATLALIKTRYDGKARQRAISFGLSALGRQWPELVCGRRHRYHAGLALDIYFLHGGGSGRAIAYPRHPGKPQP